MTFHPHRRMVLAAFLLDFAVAMGLTAMPFLLYDRLSGGAAMSGTVGAAQMALYAFGCLGSAFFVHRAGNSLLWAMAGVGVFGSLFVAVPWAHSPLLAGTVASLPFLGLALAWPALQSWMGREPDPEVRARRLTGFNTATAFGFTFSPLLAGPLYDLDYRLPFLVMLSLCGVVLALVLSLPTSPLAGPHRTAPDAKHPQASTFKLAPGLLYAAWTATFATNGLFAAARSVYPKRIDILAAEGNLTLIGDYRPTMLGLMGPATIFSWLAFLLSLTTVVCFAILGWTHGWKGRWWPLVASQLTAGASFVLLGHARSLAAMLFCFSVVGAAFGVCFFSSLYYSLAVARESHRRAAINEGALGAGGFVGGVVLGYAAEVAGIPSAFQWTPIFMVGAVFAQAALLYAFGGRDEGDADRTRGRRDVAVPDA